MKAATILALLIGTNAMRLDDAPKKHTYKNAARILHLDPNTEFPDYPEGEIKQLDEGLCRSSDCGKKSVTKTEANKVEQTGSATAVSKGTPLAEASVEAK